MHVLLRWLVLAVAVGIAAAVLPGMKVRGIGGAVLTAAIFGLLNFFIGWLLVTVIGLATLGVGFVLIFVTRWVVDVILLKVTDAFTDALTIRGLGTALVAALIMAVVGGAGEYLIHALG